MSTRLLMWLGVLGPPLAWALQHVLGIWLTQARCLPGGGDIDVSAWMLVFTFLAALLVVAAEAASIAAWRDTRDVGSEPPGSRIHFLSVIGITLGPLFLAIVLMSGLGSTAVTACSQS